MPIYEYIKNLYKIYQQNKEAVFLSTTLLLCSLLFIYRFCLWYNNIYTVFGNDFFSPQMYRFREPLTFCWLPSFFLFIFLRHKDHKFYDKIYKKIPFIFKYLFVLSKIEIYICQHLVVGTVFFSYSFFFISILCR